MDIKDVPLTEAKLLCDSGFITVEELQEYMQLKAKYIKQQVREEKKEREYKNYSQILS